MCSAPASKRCAKLRGGRFYVYGPLWRAAFRVQEIVLLDFFIFVRYNEKRIQIQRGQSFVLHKEETEFCA